MSIAESGIAWYLSYSGSEDTFNNLSESVIEGILNRNTYEDLIDEVDEQLTDLPGNLDNVTGTIETPDSENSIVLLGEADSEVTIDESIESEILQLAEDIGLIEETETVEDLEELLVTQPENETETVLTDPESETETNQTGQPENETETVLTDPDSEPETNQTSQPEEQTTEPVISDETSNENIPVTGREETDETENDEIHIEFEAPDLVAQDLSELVVDDAVAALDVDAIVAETVEEILTEIVHQSADAAAQLPGTDEDETQTTIDIDTIVDRVADDIFEEADIVDEQLEATSIDELSEDAEIAIIDTEKQEQLISYTKEEVKNLIESIAMTVLQGRNDQEFNYTPVDMENKHLIRLYDGDENTNLFFNLASVISEMHEAKLHDAQINSGYFRVSRLATSDQVHGPAVDMTALVAQSNEARKERDDERAEHKAKLVEDQRIAELNNRRYN